MNAYPEKINLKTVSLLPFRIMDKSSKSEQNKMEFFKIKSPVGKTSKQILHSYQAGEAVGYKINCMDGSFEVNEWCLCNSDILFTLLQGEIHKFLLITRIKNT